MVGDLKEGSMRILVLSNAYKPTISGVVTSISLFRQGLIAANHDVHLFVPEYEDYRDEEPYVFRFPALDLSGQLDLSLVLPFKAAMSPTARGIRPHLIHSQHPFWMGELAAALARDLDVPLVFTFHTRYDVYAEKYVPVVPKLAGKVTEEILKRYMGKCAHIVAPTPSIRDFIRREYEPDAPVSVVPTPVDMSGYHDLQPQRIRRDLGLADAELLLYVGRLADEKNLDFLLRSFAAVAAERPRARLILVGRGPHEQSLRRVVREQGLEECVVFCGPVAHDEVPHYAAAADLFVFTSLADTQGLVLIEAMAAGTPVVAVEAPGPVDVLAEGGGLLVSDQEDAFANAVLDLLDDEGRRQALSGQAVRAVERYTVPATTARMAAVYEEAVVAGGRPAKPTLMQSLEQMSVAEAWYEVGDRFRALGESLSEAFSESWEGEEIYPRLEDMRSGLKAMLDRIDRAIQISSTSDEG
jgi:1,2-diacylglycerol 3-alpha-glucosyltransferase